MNITTSIRTDPFGIATITVTLTPIPHEATELAHTLAETTLATARGGIPKTLLENYWKCTNATSWNPNIETVEYTLSYTLQTPDHGPAL